MNNEQTKKLNHSYLMNKYDMTYEQAEKLHCAILHKHCMLLAEGRFFTRESAREMIMFQDYMAYKIKYLDK